MAFDTPIMIGGGAEHSPEVFRAQTYGTSDGAEGVIRIGDLKVAQMDVPGAFVVVRPGGALILNRYPGHAGETYTVRLGEQMQIPIAATGSGSGRSDLIVARVEDSSIDPQFDPPADPATATYVFPRVISNVDANVTRVQDVPGHEADTAITLARLDIPASSEVSGATIVDLRELAHPKEKSIPKSYPLTAAGDGEVHLTSSWITWPVGTETAWGEIPIPEWATSCYVKMTWGGIICKNDSSATVRVQIGPTVNPDHVLTQTTTFSANTDASGTQTMVMHTDTVNIPEALRGTRQKFYPRAIQTGGAGDVYLYWGSSVDLNITFYGQAV